MSTYKNCYTIMEEVRRGLNEYSTIYAQATDTSGGYQNAEIVNEINKAHRYIYDFILRHIPKALLTSTTLTGVASVFTLPFDFGKLLVFKDDKLRKVYPIHIDRLKISGSTGNKRLYYRKGNTLVLDRDSVTDTYTLWYYKKCRTLDQGAATATNTLATTAVPIADYYNNMQLENISDSEVSTITDYTAARVVSITNQMDSGDFYGIISDLPEMFHYLIEMKALINLKNYPQSMIRPTEIEILDFKDQLITSVKAYAGTDEDIDMEEIFLDLEPSLPYRLGIVSEST